MKLTGNLLIGAHEIPATEGTMKALNPATNQLIEPDFALGGVEQVDRAATLADEAFDAYSHTSLAERSAFLERIADNLDAASKALAARAALETGLPEAQLQGEVARPPPSSASSPMSCAKGASCKWPSIRRNLIANPARAWIIDCRKSPSARWRFLARATSPSATRWPVATPPRHWPLAQQSSSRPTTPTRAPRKFRPEPSARRCRTAACLKVCSRWCAAVGNAIGEALVDHPLIKAVTFTGSEQGGMALYRRAQLRPEPIPVFTEMTSVNPTFILPQALAGRGSQIGDGFVERMLVNVGQACLKPAILIAIEGTGFDALRAAMAQRVAQAAARPMLTPGIHASYISGLDNLQRAGARLAAEGEPAHGDLDGQSALLEVDGQHFLSETALAHEVFGPAALLVKVRDEAQMLAVARSLRGQLSAAMHLEQTDIELARRLLPILERRTGRIVVNAFAHPQEVSFATIHGGPFPASSDSRFTSVGMTSIERFLRPVSYQGFPDALLPEALRDINALGVPRSVDGQ